jgi:predicted RNA binding protein YcfA (HicA-like mRNA interferase family)
MLPELPRISGKKAIKVFKKLGFYEARQSRGQPCCLAPGE